jgi:hypothetical protein
MMGGLGLLLSGLLLLPVGADGPAKGRIRGPRIAVEPSEFDFGEVLPNKTVEKEFTVSNQGTEELVIEKVLTDCGCTAAMLEDKRLDPGESAVLRATLRTGSRPRHLRKRVLIHSNDMGQRSFTVLLLATVVDPKGR